MQPFRCQKEQETKLTLEFLSSLILVFLFTTRIFTKTFHTTKKYFLLRNFAPPPDICMGLSFISSDLCSNVLPSERISVVMSFKIPLFKLYSLLLFIFYHYLTHNILIVFIYFLQQAPEEKALLLILLTTVLQ